MSGGQASLEIMFAFMILLVISMLLLNAMPQWRELKQKNENLVELQKNETARSALTLGYLVGDVVKFEKNIECNEETKNLKIFEDNINQISCDYDVAGRWFLK